MDDDKNILKQQCGGVTCELRQEPGINLNFTFGGGDGLRVLPVEMGGFGEKTGLIKRCRMHHREDGFSFGFETRVTIPFGIEPEIRREVEVAGNHAVFTVDVEMRNGLPVKSLRIDPLEISGPFRRIGMIPLPGDDGIVGAPQWREPSGTEEECFYRDTVPFLACLVETVDGHCWEIGTGDDLWRWQCASRFQAEAEFRVVRSGDRLTVEREVYRQREECLEPSRCLRFSWYLAWSEGSEELIPVMPEAPELVLNWRDGELPASAWIMPAVGTVGDGIPCALAHSSIKHFKSWIRSAAGRHRETTVAVAGVEPHFCCCAAHLERNRKPSLPHWDMVGLLELWQWANRQLFRSDNGVWFATPADSPLYELPSLRGLRGVPPVLE